MSYDSTLPSRLAHIQEWFGKVITTNMGNDIIAANDYITQSPTLSATERMNLYNQSYWLRLLAALHEEYPFLSRLFGTEAFNEEIGIGYLTAHPPSHWSLNYLGKDLVRYLEKSYQQSDAWLVLKAAQIDRACQMSFFAVAYPAINLASCTEDTADELLDMPLKLQSHVHLISTPGHFMHMREAFLKQPHDFWLENDFPMLDKENIYYFIIYRNNHLNVSWDTLDPVEYELLTLIQSGHTIDQALDKVEAGEEAALWIQSWLIRGWLVNS